jgi:hypothetical protein
MLGNKRTSDNKSVYFAQNIGFLTVLMKRWKKAAKMFQKINSYQFFKGPEVGLNDEIHNNQEKLQSIIVILWLISSF